jgi:DNA replication and repair protein RecF
MQGLLTTPAATMRVNHLSLTNFRNYARLELALPQQPVVIVGENAQGKTTLLESLYYLATARSPYTTSDRQLIHWRTESEPLPYARITGEISNRQASLMTLDMTLVLDQTAAAARFKKTVKVNGVEKRVMDVVGLLAVVLFLPHDLMLVEGSPSHRRDFMDDTLSQVDAEYLQALEDYDRYMTQRNALLRRIAERKAKAAELAFWDEQLARSGAVLIAGRQRFLRELEDRAQRQHQALTGGRELLTLQYQPSFAPTARSNGQRSFSVLGLDLHRELTPHEIEPQFHEQLQREQRESIERGATLSGPHRDELRLLVNERDCGLYGSRGQARTVVLALKLAELAWMEKHIGEPPLLLLDEVVAELDSTRRTYLLNQLGDQAQTLVTTTDIDVFPPEFLGRAQVWKVEGGRISAQV